MTTDNDTTRFIEERIRDHYNARISDGKSDCDYRVEPREFLEMVQRLNAKVEGTIHHVRLGLAAGETRVYPSPEVGRGAYEPCELTEPRAYVLGRSPPACLDNPVAVGDVVRLKSGQTMTVIGITDDRCACAFWQSGNSYNSFGLGPSGPQLMRDLFPTCALIRVDAP